jgi:hypothetical protein
MNKQLFYFFLFVFLYKIEKEKEFHPPPAKELPDFPDLQNTFIEKLLFGKTKNKEEEFED